MSRFLNDNTYLFTVDRRNNLRFFSLIQQGICIYSYCFHLFKNSINLQSAFCYSLFQASDCYRLLLHLQKLRHYTILDHFHRLYFEK
jgi:hypothetical protein